MYKVKRKKIWICGIIITSIIIIALLFSFNNTVINSSITGKQLEASDTTNSSDTEFVLTASQLITNKTDSASVSKNTQYLQSLIDSASNSGGGIVHIPAGTYYFGTSGKSVNGTKDYVIYCKSNVTVEGEGTSTILKPYGTTSEGLDMFYFNKYSDSNYSTPEYIENANFREFTIDGSDAKCVTYTTSGKGFLLNLCKNCNIENVKVMNTDGTGIGIDCAINSSIVNCTATGCGKAATESQQGASGFGIGTGYSEDESLYIENCEATDNKKYGILFEHQGKFNPSAYRAKTSNGFVVRNCESNGNRYDIGGDYAHDVIFENCTGVGNTSFIHSEKSSRRVQFVNCNVKATLDDVTDSSQYYYEPVYWALNNGITDGITTTRFGVDTDIKRGQVITMLWRMAGMPGNILLKGEQYDNVFEDVTSSSPYIDAIKWAKDKNILGLQGRTFSPDRGCTRGEFIVFLWKFAGSEEMSGMSGFSDIESNTELAKAANWAIKKGITNGMNGAFGTDNICEREDIVTFLYRYNNSEDTDFDITYDLEGGTLSGSNPTSYVTGNGTSTFNIPSKRGYTFLGWTGSNGSRPEKNVSVTSSDRGNRAYTANWRKNTYTIEFNANGGTGTVQPMKLSYNELNALPKNNFTKTGSEFVGWNTKENGTGESFANKARVINLTETDGSTITLYAQWKQSGNYDVTFKVKHYKEQLDGQYKLEETDTYEAIAGTEATPDRKSYKGFTAPNAKTVTIKADGSTEVQYYYTRNSYKVTIKRGSGIESVAGEGTYKFDQNVTVSATAKKGYENPTWKLKGNTISNTFLMPAGDIELNVTSQAIKYPIKYNLNGGEMASNPSEYTIEDEITLREPLKPGYDFIGWTGSNGTTAQKNVTITKGSTGEKNYTANWKEDPNVDMEVVIKYSITSPTKDNVTVTIKSNVPINVPKGWTKGADEYTITKVYEQNVNETVTITSKDGKSLQANIKIENIDKDGLNAQVSYDYIKQENKVIVTIKTSNDVENIDGWNKVDNRTFKKEYTENKQENITIRDLSGNETQVQINVNQISSGENPGEGPGTDPENPGENPNTDPDKPGENPNDDSNDDSNDGSDRPVINPDNSNGSQSSNSGNNNSSNNTHLINTQKNEDKTTANTVIPQTGSNLPLVIITIIGVAIVGTISFIKFRKYKIK